MALVIQEWNLKQDPSTISVLVNGHYEILKCLVDSRRVIWELSYPMALLSLQILISPLIVRSRRNYKEGLLFCCGSVSVLFVWIGWITAFMLFDEGQDPAWQDITICSGLVATPTVLLLVIFIPKVCVICFHEKKIYVDFSDVVKDPKPRNPRGTTSTFKSPTRTRPRKLIPEQNPKPDIQTPKPRKPPKVLNLYIKYLKITIKINKKNFKNFSPKSIIYFSTFKSKN